MACGVTAGKFWPGGRTAAGPERHLGPWRNGSAALLQGEGCPFKSDRVHEQVARVTLCENRSRAAGVRRPGVGVPGTRARRCEVSAGTCARRSRPAHKRGSGLDGESASFATKRPRVRVPPTPPRVAGVWRPLPSGPSTPRSPQWERTTGRSRFARQPHGSEAALLVYESEHTIKAP